MLFESPHALYRVICTPTRFKRHPTTGDIIETTPSITAEFGKLAGPEYSFLNPETGETMTGATIIGHRYDTDEEARAHGWDKDTKEMVERKLLALAARQPEDIRQVEVQVPKAAAPWPTYDDLDAAEAAETAIKLGLAGQALVYENENRQRPLTVETLTAHLDAQDGGDAVVSVAPAAKRKAAEAVGGATITL